MAKATAKTETVVTTVYTLELSQDEAIALVDILSRISGPPDSSRRGLASNIYEGLVATGVLPVFKMDNYDGSRPEDLEGHMVFSVNKPRLDPKKLR